MFQIGLSVLMWRGCASRWRGILPLAIAVHALVDVPAALFQAQLVPLAAVDARVCRGSGDRDGVAVPGVQASRGVPQTAAPDGAA